MALSEYKPCIDRCEESRGSPYYNDWQWAVSWNQTEISVLRGSLDSYQVTKALANRRYWEQTRGFGRQHAYSKVTVESVINAAVESNIETVRAWLANNHGDRKLVFSNDQITVYTNDSDAVEQLVDLAQSVFSARINIKQAIVDLPADTVCLKKPYDYSYRTYFRSREMSSQAQQTLLNWITSMDKNVYACPSLTRFLHGHSRLWGARQYTWDHYFVDHNDSKLDVWIAMVCPGIIRKTMAIQSPAK
jgi:hypothetical protein